MPTKELKGVSGHPSYHGVMTGEEAQQSLYENGSSCFLTRFSEDKSCYRLSVLKKGRNNEIIFQHFNIIVKTDMPTVLYEIEGAEEEFDDIFKLLSYYQSHPLNHQIDQIGNCLMGHSASASFQRKRNSLPPLQRTRRWSLSPPPVQRTNSPMQMSHRKRSVSPDVKNSHSAPLLLKDLVEVWHVVSTCQVGSYWISMGSCNFICCNFICSKNLMMDTINDRY